MPSAAPCHGLRGDNPCYGRRHDPGTVDVLLQVNVAGEKTKFGCSIPAAIHLAEQIDTMIQLRLRGLMTMAPTARTRRIRGGRSRPAARSSGSPRFGDRRRSLQHPLDGMSSDYEVAVEEGANMVRVGTGIFGEPRVGWGRAEETDD